MIISSSGFCCVEAWWEGWSSLYCIVIYMAILYQCWDLNKLTAVLDLLFSCVLIYHYYFYYSILINLFFLSYSLWLREITKKKKIIKAFFLSDSEVLYIWSPSYCQSSLLILLAQFLVIKFGHCHNQCQTWKVSKQCGFERQLNSRIWYISINQSIYIYTHTHIYIYIYIYRERERERDKCSYHNGYCCRKWTQWTKFKSCIRLFAFHIALIL